VLFRSDSDLALPQFLAAGGLDFIVFDYLAEITMSIMARQRQKDPSAGFATDFVHGALRPHLREIKRQGVRIISNAGGVNPAACGRAVEALIASAGVNLRVAVVEGDDLLHMARALRAAAVREMYSGAPFPDPEKLASINAYMGAFPIARALDEGADIVITGRCVDSAVTLGACIHAFGWSRSDLSLLAAGSLCGHILECGPQATGGNFTDWRDVPDTDMIGYPIAEIEETGSFLLTKPPGTGGLVSPATVAEQMLYEIGDPAAYLLPDVCCDFSEVRIEEAGPDMVRVSGARGYAPPEMLKACATYEDGWRAGTVAFFYGDEADDKARAFADSVVRRARTKLRSLNAPDFDEVLIELIGDESLYGAERQRSSSRDVALKLAVRHRDQRGAGLILKEFSGHGLGGPPGLSGFAGARPQPSPVVRLFSFLTSRADVPARLLIDGISTELGPDPEPSENTERVRAFPAPPPPPANADELVETPLSRLAWARSGDKGDKANIGVIARHPRFMPWIWAQLTEEEIARRFSHYSNGKTERFYLPGTSSMNILLHDVLGGGGIASLRNDPQAKGYSQILLQTPIPVPRNILRSD